MTRSFTILKSGETVLGDATGSATITPTIVITATPSAQPTVEPNNFLQHQLLPQHHQLQVEVSYHLLS